jgi:hypothetical protein
MWWHDKAQAHQQLSVGFIKLRVVSKGLAGQVWEDMLLECYCQGALHESET